MDSYLLLSIINTKLRDFNNNLVEVLPAKSKKTKQRNRFFYYVLVENENSIFLEKRENKDIWKNLYQLPLIETENELTDAEIMALNLPFPKNYPEKLKNQISLYVQHILELHERNPQTPYEQELLQREIDATDAQIDRLVYDLYGLTEEEIKIVEGEG